MNLNLSTEKQLLHSRVTAVVAGVAAVVALGMAYCHSGPTTLPLAIQRRLDSAAVTLPQYQHTIAALRAQHVADSLQADSLIRQGRQAVVVSQHYARLADSLAAVASAGTLQPGTIAVEADSNWHLAYLARTAEAVQLRAALHDDSLAFGKKVHEAATETARADTAEARRAALEKLNVDLGAQVAKLTECSVNLLIWHPRCPSRTSIALLSAGITAAATNPQLQANLAKLIGR